MPDLEQILKLEERSRHAGSGLRAADLAGSWRLEKVAPQGSRQMDAMRSALLRSLAARLDLRPDTKGDEGLSLENSVRVGSLRLRFVGTGELHGRRPLLRFHFQRLQLWLGPWELLNRALPPPDPRRGPFFALIAAGDEKKPGAGQVERWLAARGRSGGVALWYRRESAPSHAHEHG